MQHDFWLERWQQQEIGFHLADVNLHLKTFWPTLKLRPGSRVFVPFCGKTLDLLWLRRQGLFVNGCELSPIAVNDFFQEQQLKFECIRQGGLQRFESDNVRIWQGDFFSLSPERLGPIDAVFDRGALVALPPEMRYNYVEYSKVLLPETVRILLVTFDYPQEQMSGPPFSVSESEIKRLYGDDFEVKLLHEQEILADNPRFEERGLQEGSEKVYLLTPTAQ